MNPKATLALMTDFGDRDGFTGVLKGVMLSIFNEATLVDIAHHIPPQDIRHASWVLDRAFDVFPPHTVFICVVDPGVGSPHQRHLLCTFPNRQKVVVLPDNGLITRVLKRHAPVQCVAIQNSRYFRNQETPSTTFHGRDIYAPVAAHAAKAITTSALPTFLESLGPPCKADEIQTLDFPSAVRAPNGELHGHIDVVDTYGNLITTLPNEWVTDNPQQYTAHLGGRQCKLNPGRYYASPSGFTHPSPVFNLVMGSHGMLEIACYGKSAQQHLDVKPGDVLVLVPTEAG